MFELIYPVEPAAVLPRPTVENPGAGKTAGSEMLPVVEENGLVVGQAPRKTVHGDLKYLHPVVHLHIINRESRLYLQKRSTKKDLLPGRWDTAVGGHVDYGERLEDALYRETVEELGLRNFNPVLLNTYLWTSEIERELVNVFATVGDFDLHPSNDEVEEGRWWSMEEISGTLGKDVFTPNFEQEFLSVRDTLLALL